MTIGRLVGTCLLISLLASCAGVPAPEPGNDDRGAGSVRAADPDPAGGGERRESRSRPQVTAELARWPADAPAACSITFDDGTLDQYLVAAPLLDERGIRASFFLITGGREQGLWLDGVAVRRLFSWEKARDLQRRGHEIASHTADHRDLARYATSAKEQFGRAVGDLQREVPGADLYSFSWPYWRSAASSRALVTRFHGAARSGTVMGESPAVATEWTMVGSHGVLATHSAQKLLRLVDQYRASGGWAVLNFHGLSSPGLAPEERGWEPLDVRSFTTVLDGLVERGLWCAPFGEVARYQRQRDATRLVLEEDEDGLHVRANAQLSGRSYRQPLTILLRVDGPHQQVLQRQLTPGSTLSVGWEELR